MAFKEGGLLVVLKEGGLKRGVVSQWSSKRVVS